MTAGATELAYMLDEFDDLFLSAAAGIAARHNVVSEDDLHHFLSLGTPKCEMTPFGVRKLLCDRLWTATPETRALFANDLGSMYGHHCEAKSKYLRKHLKSLNKAVVRMIETLKSGAGRFPCRGLEVPSLQREGGAKTKQLDINRRPKSASSGPCPSDDSEGPEPPQFSSLPDICDNSEAKKGRAKTSESVAAEAALPFPPTDVGTLTDPSTLMCEKHYISADEKRFRSATPRQLIASFTTEGSKVQKYLHEKFVQSAGCVSETDFDKLWKAANPLILIFRCAWQSIYMEHLHHCFSLPAGSEGVVVLSKKSDLHVLFGCSNCCVGRLVNKIVSQITQKMKKINMTVEELVSLEELAFLTPPDDVSFNRESLKALVQARRQIRNCLLTLTEGSMTGAKRFSKMTSMTTKSKIFAEAISLCISRAQSEGSLQDCKDGLEALSELIY